MWAEGPYLYAFADLGRPPFSGKALYSKVQAETQSFNILGSTVQVGLVILSWEASVYQLLRARAGAGSSS